MGEGLPQRHRALEAAAFIVVRLPHLPGIGVADRLRSIVDDRQRGVLLAGDRRRIEERLESRSRLPMGLGTAIERRAVEVVSPGHRDDLAGGGIDRHQRSLNFWNLIQRDFQLLARGWDFHHPDSHHVSGFEDIGHLGGRLGPFSHASGPRPADRREWNLSRAADQIDLRSLAGVVDRAHVSGQSQPLLQRFERDSGLDQHFIRGWARLGLGSLFPCARLLVGAILLRTAVFASKDAREVGHQHFVAVPFARLVNPFGDQSLEDVEAGRGQSSEGSAVAHPAIERLQPGANRVIRQGLQLGHHRDVHPHPALQHRFLPVPGNQASANLLGVVGPGGRIGPRPERDWFLHLFPGDRFGHESVLRHLGEHVLLALLGLDDVRHRIDGMRSLRDAGQSGGFSDREILGIFSEVVERRFLDAVSVVAEVDLVEIEVENLILVERPLHPRREDPLLDFSGERSFLRKKQIAA